MKAELRALSDALTAAARAREGLIRQSETEYAHEDDALLAAAEADVAAVRRVLRAYRAAVAASEDADPKLSEHLRAERRWVARLDARTLRVLAKAYGELLS